MRCFQITETVRLGMEVVRSAYPIIPTPPTCPRLILADEIARHILELPDGDLRYGSTRDANGRPFSPEMEVDIGKDHIMLGRPTKRTDRKALVLLGTAGGDGGKVFLSANTYDSEVAGGKKPRVKRCYRAFPDAGVIPLCSDAEVARVNKGVMFLELLVLMYEGASFRIFRNGKLEGASPQMFVHWNGETLRTTIPRRYEDRAGAFFETVGA